MREVEELLRLAFHLEPDILMLLVAGLLEGFGLVTHGGVNTSTFPDTIGPHHRVITHVQVTFFTHKLLHRGIGIFIEGGENGEAL